MIFLVLTVLYCFLQKNNRVQNIRIEYFLYITKVFPSLCLETEKNPLGYLADTPK